MTKSCKTFLGTFVFDHKQNAWNKISKIYTKLGIVRVSVVVVSGDIYSPQGALDQRRRFVVDKMHSELLRRRRVWLQVNFVKIIIHFFFWLCILH